MGKILTETTIMQPDFTGREEQFDILKNSMASAFTGNGSTVLISGEAGIGKTRLVSEIMKLAEEKGAARICGWCLAENLEPLMPVKEALRNASMLALLSDKPPPKVISAYLMNDAGLLIAKAERTETDLDADIFASMLKAVGNFIKDSLGMIGQSEGGGLNTIGYANFKIILRSRGRQTLAVVIEGDESEFLIEEMGKKLAGFEGKFNPDIIETSKVAWLELEIAEFITSGKYEGTFLIDDPRIRQENMYDAVLIGLRRAAADSPLIFFLDDIQWADPSTLNLFHYLARNTREHKILLLATYRPEDLQTSAEGKPHHLELTLQNMSRENLFTDIRLERFGPEDTAIVIKKTLGGFDAPPDFASKIYRETEGNPFFILEVIKLLAEEGHLVEKDGRWELGQSSEDIKLPSKIYDVVIRRLNRLMREQRDILECASVVGEEFGSDVVGTTLAVNRITLLKNLGELEKTHRLIHSREKTYWFDHSKIREVLYNGINAELRAEYHKIVAESYLQLYQGREDEIIEELAHHFQVAGDPRATDFLIRAGDRAKEHYANEEAIRFYTAALSSPNPLENITEVIENLGDVQKLAGHFKDSVATFSKGIELAPEPRRKAHFHYKVSDAQFADSDYNAGIEAANKGLALLGDENCVERIRLLTTKTWNLIRMGDYDASAEHLVEALKSGELIGEKKEASMAFHLMGIVNWFRGDYEAALGDYRKALALREETGDTQGRLNTLNNIGVVYMETGKLDAALEYFIEGAEYEERVRNKSGLAGALDNIGNVYHTQGKLDKALDMHLRSLELYRQSGDRNGTAWALSSLGYIWPDVGQPDKGIESFKASLEICEEIGDKQIKIYNLYGLGEANVKAKDYPEAHKWIDRALELSLELGARREEGASYFVRATILRDEGQPEKSLAEFDTARKILTEVGDNNLLNMLDLEFGIYLKMKGDMAGARETLAKARDAFEFTGMKYWQGKAEEELEKL